MSELLHLESKELKQSTEEELEEFRSDLLQGDVPDGSGLEDDELVPIDSPDRNIQRTVEELWDLVGPNEYLDSKTDTRSFRDKDLKYGLGMIYAATNVIVLPVNPLASLGMTASLVGYGALKARKNEIRRKRRNNLEARLDKTYKFDEDADLTSLIEQTEGFQGVGDTDSFSRLYKEVLGDIEDIPVEAEYKDELMDYKKDTTQILWIDESGEKVDYQLEITYDGFRFLEINGYVEDFDFEDILQQSNSFDIGSLVREYDDVSVIQRQDVISKLGRRISSYYDSIRNL